MAGEMKFDIEMANEYAKGVRRTLPTYDAMYKMTHSYIRQSVGEQASILVVGAGGGTELEVFGSENKGWTFTAVDPSAPMLAVAEMKARELGMMDRVKFLTGTAADLAEGQVYDAATCMLVLHFISDKAEKLEALKNMNRFLKPGAPLVISSMFGEPGEDEFEGKVDLWRRYWLDRTKLSVKDIDDMEVSIRSLSFLSEREIRSLLADAGFERTTKFLETAMFGGWICHKKESGDQ